MRSLLLLFVGFLVVVVARLASADGCPRGTTLGTDGRSCVPAAIPGCRMRGGKFLCVDEADRSVTVYDPGSAAFVPQLSLAAALAAPVDAKGATLTSSTVAEPMTVMPSPATTIGP